MKLRDLFTGDPVRNPELQDLVNPENPEPLQPRNEAEDKVRACLPGDDVTQHPLYQESNPYLTNPFTMGTMEKMRQLRAGTLQVSREEEQQIRAAWSILNGAG